MTIHINIGKGFRIVVYPEGGSQLETYVKGIGWCLDNDALSDDEYACALLAAQQILNRVAPAYREAVTSC